MFIYTRRQRTSCIVFEHRLLILNHIGRTNKSNRIMVCNIISSKRRRRKQNAFSRLKQVLIRPLHVFADTQSNLSFFSIFMFRLPRSLFVVIYIYVLASGFCLYSCCSFQVNCTLLNTHANVTLQCCIHVSFVCIFFLVLIKYLFVCC